MNLSYLRNKDFESNAPSEIFHGFFTRKGGVSEGIYSSLNCAYKSNDKPENIKQNLALVAKECGVEEGNVLTLRQIHSKICIYADKVYDVKNQAPEADAFVTDKKNIALGILTADCAPVLFHGSKQDGKAVIGVAHAGWAGAFRGVLEQTVQKMKDIGAMPESINAIIGPCINLPSYEVSEDFMKKFLEQNPENEIFFKNNGKSGFCNFDLEGYCAARLATAGVHKVILSGLDTYSLQEDYFSYRRSVHDGESDYGRQISVICIK